MFTAYKWYTISAIFIFILAIACSKSIVGPDGPSGELPRDLTPQEKLLIEADQQFSYEIFKQTVAFDSDEENLMISPLSISMALAMTLNGAQGDTFDEMREALFLNGLEIDEINNAFKSLTELLTTADRSVTIKIANSIWHRNGLPVEEEFLDKMREFFDARIEGLDFSDPAAPDVINAWVKENTEGLIEEIIEEIEPHIVMYLINALYFKGDWLRPFDTDDTRRAEFKLETGGTVQTDMMHQEGKFALYFSENVQMVEIPYGDSLFSMTVLIPADADMPINQFIDEHITAGNLASWRANMSVDSREITLQLPKFEFEYEIEYNDILKSMGIVKAFDEWEANLKGIADVSPQNLYIDHVKHKTFIRVDEEGTEAAAVTSVGIGITSMPPQMIVDRPFVFIIHERESGTNLFLGKVMNPAL